MTDWYRLDVDATLKALETSRDGLSSEEAARRLAQHGPNRLEERRLRSPWQVLLGQFTEIMVIVLIIAAAVSWLIGESSDAIMILIIVVLNAILGFTQEYRAERAMAALRQLATPTARVRRDGHMHELGVEALVPGDIILLEAGDRIPADARLIETANLRVEEAALTGESASVHKTIKTIEGENLPLGDRINTTYMGTSVAFGRGVAVVTGTGMRTQLGHIAHMIQEVGEERTPLQRRMAELGKWLAVGSLGLVIIVFILGVWRGEPVIRTFLTAVSLAVAAIPEGLPAVVTIALALGAQRMIRRNALIRKLPAVETLGSVTVICSDKTGTLTENRMTVTVLDVAGQSLNLVEQLRIAGPIIAPDEAPLGHPQPSIGLLLAGGSLCNDASLEPNDAGSSGYHAVGDPTEGALVVAAARMGLWKTQIEQALPRIGEAPFSSERKRMTTVHRRPPAADQIADAALRPVLALLPKGAYVAFTKGSVDGLLGISSHVWDVDHVAPLDDQWLARIRAANNALAAQGTRVLGVAMRAVDRTAEDWSEDELERDLTFIGIAGMIDPPRPEVRDAVAECRSAGIRPVMITGDHPLTALSIAQDLGIIGRENAARAITGQELADMPVAELQGQVDQVSVYARVSPEHKVKIVAALKDRGHFVAMTGDGVNDAPALKRADIGVAMGITGTDVSKEAADMVLLDDNFATIVHAVEEGRTIYENIRKFVRYIASSNVGEILIMLMAPVLGYPIPLTPIQLLWINLLTDGLPALALGVEPADPSIMRRPPHRPGESVLARGLGSYVLWVGLLLGSVCLGAQIVGITTGSPAWRTMVFTTLGLSQMGNALAVRSDRESLFKLGLFSNKPLVGAILLSTLLQMVVIYVPFLQNLFDTEPLSLDQLVIVFGLSAILFVTVEISKWVRRRRQPDLA